jgi:hypothetical protein
MRNVALTLAACTLLLGGCHKIVHLSIRNHTTGTYRMELDGDHESRDDIGVLPGRGAVGYDVWVKKKELPEEFELEIGNLLPPHRRVPPPAVHRRLQQRH